MSMPADDEGTGTEVGLSAADHSQGDPQARVTLLEYGDYECAACIQAAPLVQHLVDSNNGRLRFVFRHFHWWKCIPTPSWPQRPPKPPRRKASSGQCTTCCSLSRII